MSAETFKNSIDLCCCSANCRMYTYLGVKLSCRTFIVSKILSRVSLKTMFGVGLSKLVKNVILSNINREVVITTSLELVFRFFFKLLSTDILLLITQAIRSLLKLAKIYRERHFLNIHFKIRFLLQNITYDFPPKNVLFLLFSFGRKQIFQKS